MILQPILDLVAICAHHGIRQVVLSPGSRCAPLTLAFARHPEMEVKTISDERSAAFIALGMAQQLKQPVVLVCTSGSATLNYFPAIAEAFFQQNPLLVLTADRPPEWVDQWDGQTVFQEELYGKHVKKSFKFPDSFAHPDQVWVAQRTVNEAIHLSRQFPAGPVHINIPLREPFYPEQGEVFEFSKQPRTFQVDYPNYNLGAESLAKLKQELQGIRRLLLVPGQQQPNPELLQVLEELARTKRVVVVADSISNMQGEGSITLHDHWMGEEVLQDDLRPDLLLTFGKSIISKSLKLFLRKQQVTHWHIQSDGQAKDTFQSLSRVLASEPLSFLRWMLGELPMQDKGYFQGWQDLEIGISAGLHEILRGVKFGEYGALATVLNQTPSTSLIHVANSMAIRYVNFLGRRTQEICCNRGTSGIDGSISTAVGACLVRNGLVTLITGDMAFFYDRNAFWHNYTLSNLRIILLNNHAGGIFRLINGPTKQPELEEYFETKQSLSAKSLASEYRFHYASVTTSEELESALLKFYEPSLQPKIIEIDSSSPRNADILKQIKGSISASLVKRRL
ncbi:MAG: 2-succinyl-5-enolpyruvyl-6-hydroxy-3-cyclohexene-1-carboxylic-acid synthase [Bacteroidetes bacterium]|nr:2-succinyl-5-enolpyruvyl-6-hydroxy-3-cyclohexene-1-carboxylic-acid synthase [Bacteroidota bacterium]